MRFKVFGWIAILLMTVSLADSDTGAGRSPYAGLEDRPIKSLSVEDVDGYLGGKGMGFAMAAELNSYPGPKHVLELSEELELEQDQEAKTRAAFRVMHEEAVQLGQTYVTLEQELEELFRAAVVDEGRLAEVVSRSAEVRGRLRLAHLKAHVVMREVLTPQQILHYDRLRGYSSGECPHAAGSAPGH